MMKSLVKPAVLIVLLLLMFIPVTVVYEVIQDRLQNRNIAKHSISESWTRAQSFSGPWLVVNYETEHDVKVTDSQTKQVSIETHKKQHQAYYRPQQQLAKGDLDVSYRYRKVFKVPVYQTGIKQQARFDFTALYERLTEHKNTQIKSAFLQYRISDKRGLLTQPQVMANGTPLLIKPSTEGFHADVSDWFATNAQPHHQQVIEPIELDLEMTLAGMESLSLSPMALDNQFSLVSAWPHPSFSGDFLPTSRSVSEDGFEANWSISAFATGVNEKPQGSLSEDDYYQVSVKLYDPIDVYVLNDRAAKYAMLFIVLAFAVFYLFEVLKHHQVHPIKYGLVGLSLSFFFLLLLSFSEKIGFIPSYLIAAAVSTGLIAIYMKPEFGRSGAWVLGGLLTAMFATILVILKLENESLIVGSVFAFAILASVMLMTRKVDWHKTTFKP